MDRHQRLTILAEAATGDREHGLPSSTGRPDPAVGIRKVFFPGGGFTNIMRVMQTNACSMNCGYCPFHAGARLKRVALAPEEVATTFMEAHRKGLAQGLFLTSGIPREGVKSFVGWYRGPTRLRGQPSGGEPVLAPQPLSDTLAHPPRAPGTAPVEGARRSGLSRGAPVRRSLQRPRPHRPPG